MQHAAEHIGEEPSFRVKLRCKTMLEEAELTKSYVCNLSL